jgi:Raf kinase inhibitor-like YbhB/YbcL family protein
VKRFRTEVQLSSRPNRAQTYRVARSQDTPSEEVAMLEKLPDALGHALRDQRAGIDKIAFNALDLRVGMGALAVTSIGFQDHAPMPVRYTDDGEGISPPLQWTGVPSNAASIVVMVEDADAPTPQPLVHAIVVGLAATEAAIGEGALDSRDHKGAGLQTGKNSFLGSSWLPPDPPPGHGVHRYAFQVFALRHLVAFSDTPGREEVMDALHESAIASGLLIGTYQRPDGSVTEGAEQSSPAPFATVT